MARPVVQLDGRTLSCGQVRDIARGTASATVTGDGRERAREDYQSGCGGHRARLGLFPVIIAAFAAWFVLFDLHALAFAWPGKLAIFLAVFAVVRRVVWRVIAASRNRGGR